MAKKAVSEKTKSKAKAKVKAVEQEPVPQVDLGNVKVITKAKSESDQEKTRISIEKKLIALFRQQQIDSKIDKIRLVRGELPLEVQDLEDDVAGLETRVNNILEEVEVLKKKVADKTIAAKECDALIRKYDSQKMNVRNNREFNSLTKEIEYQELEKKLCEKRCGEYEEALEAKNAVISSANEDINKRKDKLEQKKSELTGIIAETEKDEEQLIEESEKNHSMIEDRLLGAYKKIRTNARNGLAVVVVERDACGGCFNKIPPQRQLDIRMHQKIIVCEFCGRILVDDAIDESVSI